MAAFGYAQRERQGGVELRKGVDAAAEVTQAVRALNAPAIDHMRGVVKAKTGGIFPNQSVIMVHLALPSFQSVRIGGLIVILVHRHDKWTGVNHRGSQPPGFVDQPGIPGSPANPKVGDPRPQVRGGTQRSRCCPAEDSAGRAL